MRAYQWFFLLALSVISGCAIAPEYNESAQSGAIESEGQPFVIFTDLDENGSWYAQLPDGTEYRDQADYRSDIPEITATAISQGYEVKLYFGESLSEQIDMSLEMSEITSALSETEDGISSVPQALSVGFGYNLTFASGYTYISGCVKSNGYRIAIHLNRYSSQIFDLHLATYSKNGYRCFGAYESVYKYINWCTCSPVSYDQVKNAIYQVAIAAGIASGVALVIAEISAPIAIGALAL